MKVLAVLCLLGVVAADPQLFLPYNTPLLTPTIKTDAGVINTYTATYPHAGLPLVRAALPYNWGFNPYAVPTVLAAKPVDVTASRQKRDADPEPAINFPTIPATVDLKSGAIPAATIPTTVATIPSTLATIPTTYNYQYTGLPAAVSTYTVPQTLPWTGVSPLVGTYPFTTGLTTTGLTHYTAGWPLMHPVVTTAKVETPKEETVARAKRDADPEADPQLLTTTTGVTGFSYPAINTGTLLPTTYTYNTVPATYPTRYTTGWTGLTGLPGYPFGTGATVYG